MQRMAAKNSHRQTGHASVDSVEGHGGGEGASLLSNQSGVAGAAALCAPAIGDECTVVGGAHWWHALVQSGWSHRVSSRAWLAVTRIAYSLHFRECVRLLACLLRALLRLEAGHRAGAWWTSAEPMTTLPLKQYKKKSLERAWVRVACEAVAHTTVPGAPADDPV